MNYQQMDQTQWVCYQLPDSSYYYGEVAYLDQAGIVHSKDNQEAANNPANRLVRHGFGIHLYNTQASQPSKYQGTWDRDQKQGQGTLTVPQQFKYTGGFKEGAYHQQGKMEWANGDVYEGQWKKNRMEGGGVFRHHDGFVLKGSFKANYFIDGNFLRNPLMGQKEYILFRKQGKEIAKQKERNQKVKNGFVVKIKSSDSQKLLETIIKSNKNNRVPLLIASEASHFNLESLKQLLALDRQCHCFDLRKASLLKAEDKYNYKQAFALMTRAALKNGEALVINLDESPSPYQHAFYPDLKQFYDSNGFNMNTWSRETMSRREVYQRLVGDKISDSYMILVWSKMKLGEGLNEQQIRQKLQMRLQSIIPFIRMDIVMCVGGE